MLIREARNLGVERMVMTHAMRCNATLAQMKEAANLGAYLEFVYNQLLGRNRAHDIKDYAAAIRAVGPQHCILSGDLGQPDNPLHPDGLEAFLRGMREQGFTEADIDQMARKNPAALLGLP